MNHDYLVMEADTKDEWIEQDEVRFALLGLDQIFLQRLLEKCRIVAAANMLAGAQGHVVYSLGFYNADPLLVRNEAMDNPQEELCDRISDLSIWRDNPAQEVIINLDEGEVDALDTVWGQYHELHIDADGEWFEWEVHTKVYTLWFRWYPSEEYAWVVEPLLEAKQRIEDARKEAK